MSIYQKNFKNICFLQFQIFTWNSQHTLQLAITAVVMAVLINLVSLYFPCSLWFRNIMQATQIVHPLLNVLRGHGQHLCIPYLIPEHYHILLENVTDTPWWPLWPLEGRKPCQGPDQFHFHIRGRQHQPRARLRVFRHKKKTARSISRGAGRRLPTKC